MSIIKNATLSIQAGLEDLASATPSRTLSCVRNLHAGVLLLLKAKLQELSPSGSDDVLLKQRVLPQRDSSGKVEFIGKGTKTVDAHELEIRLTSLGVSVDWKRVERLTRERNSIEHYYATVSDVAVRALAADVLVVIRDFVHRELGLDPRALFGTMAWEQLLSNGEVYAREKDECDGLLRSIPWESATLASAILEYPCEACGSPLLMPNDPAADAIAMTCRSCGHSMDPHEYIPASLENYLAHDSFMAAKEGVGFPLGTCPGCFTDSFVIEEDVCALCGYERGHDRCLRCDAELELDEQELRGLCGYCHHVATKDD